MKPLSEKGFHVKGTDKKTIKVNWTNDVKEAVEKLKEEFIRIDMAVNNSNIPIVTKKWLARLFRRFEKKVDNEIFGEFK